MREAGGGKLEAGSGEPKAGGTPIPFAQIMADEGMVTPDALERSMRAAVGFDSQGMDAEGILRAAEKLLDGVLAGACESRETALDLLTIDALVTRAMEIAARDPKSLAEFPEQAMKRIATR